MNTISTIRLTMRLTKKYIAIKFKQSPKLLPTKMTKRLLLLLLPLLIAQPLTAHGYCKDMWEVSALLRTAGADATLEFGGQPKTNISAEWLRGISIVAAKIDAAAGIDTTLYLCAESAPNAFATRDNSGRNIIGLTFGMYRLLGNDWHAYAGLLGHENAHLIKNHGTKRQKRQAGLALGQAALNILTKNNLPSIAGIDLVALSAQAFDASYNRDEESEADQYGMRYAVCAGFAADGGLRLQRKLNSASNFLSSHPSSRQRIAAMRAAIAAQPRQPNCN